MSTNSVSPTNLSVSQFSEGFQNSTKAVDDDVKSQQIEESYIFPLFSEVSRVTRIPSIFCIIQIIIQLIQSLVANLFIGNLHIWKSFSTTPRALRYLSYTINLGIIDIINKGNSENNDNISEDNFNNCWPIYAVMIIFTAVEIIFIAILLFIYRKKRLFLKWTLYVANFLIYVLNPILFTPICGIFGFAFWQVDSHQSSSSIAFLVISLIPALLILMIIVFGNNFSCNSVYLSKSFDSCWDSRARNLFTITIGLSSFLAPLLNCFSKWFVFVGFILILFFNVYQLLILYYLPYLKEIMNSIIQSCCLLSIVSIVLSFAHYFTGINDYILIFVPIAVFVIFMFFYYFFDKHRVKSLLQKMDTNSETNTDENKKEFMDSITKGNDDKVIFYIHVGISNISPIFVDYSIIKYITTVKQTLRIMFALIQITAMLPAQMQFLSILVANVILNEAQFNITQKFILYQARKVNVIRQSVSSKEERSEAKLLYKMSEETISLVRGFWGEIAHLKSDISTASLRYFKNATNRTSSSYLDAIEQYPRSQKLYDQYIRFLIEAKGDYRESIKYRKNLIMIEKGKKIVHDYAFRSFVNAFPKYLTEHILDSHGMYIDKSNQIQSNDGNMTANSSQISSTSGLNKTYHDDEISATIFDHSKLRLALQDVINRSTMNSLNLLRSFSIVTFILISLMIIILLVVITTSSDSLHSIIKSISLTSKILTSIQYTGLLIATRLVEKTAIENYVSEYGDELTNQFCYYKTVMSDQLSIENTSFPQEPSLYSEPLVKINMVIKDIRSYLQEEMKMIFTDPDLHKGEIFLFHDWSLNSSHLSYYKKSEVLFQITVSLVSSLHGIINMALRQDELVSATGISIFNDPLNIFVGKSEFFAIVCLNDIIISNGFDDIFLNISQNGIDVCDGYSNIYDVLTYIISIIAIIIFFVCRLINYLYMRKEFKNLSYLLKGFNKDDIIASSKPIYLKSKDPLPTGTVHSAHDFSVEIYMIPFLYFLITADCIVVVVYMCMQTQDYYETFAHVFDWSHSAAQRASSIMRLAIALNVDNYENRDLFEDMEYTNVTDSIIKIINYQNQIDMEIIGKDSRFDEFYYFDHCKDFGNDYDFADFADCLSVSNKINAAINQMINMNNLNTDDGDDDDSGIGWPGDGPDDGGGIGGWPDDGDIGVGWPDDGSGDGDIGVGWPDDGSGDGDIGVGWPDDGDIGVGWPDDGDIGVGWPDDGPGDGDIGVGWPDDGPGVGWPDDPSIGGDDNQKLGIIYSYDYAALMYQIDKSIYSEFISFMDYLITFSDKISDENNTKIQTIGIIGIVILIILFIIENIFISMLYNSLEGFKQLIYTISPISACRNRSLILFLSKKTLDDDGMSTVDFVLNNSQFSIVTINENFIIQTINQEFCKLTDYSSQKLLGQSITYLIPLPTDGNGKIVFESSPFYSALNEMRDNSNENDSCSVKIKMRKEDLNLIHMNANLIKITDSSNSFKGVTLLLKSNEENVEMKNKLEQEKMNVNNLIKVLIPRGALSSVKGKKQSTFFKADQATLISIEIAGMSDFISMMSPKGILDILQQIYNGIDLALKKFDSISMVRWENEMIFAVSGLFDNVGDFKKQAFETTAFMIEILQNLEDTNIQTNTDFHLRLCAHIGGPVTGFVKDPNCPYFNILSSSFKYLNYMKENGPIDKPWLTASFVKHLDLSIFNIQKESTFVLDDINENIYSVQFKEGYKPPNDDVINENDGDVNDVNEVKEDEEEQNDVNEVTEVNDDDDEKNDVSEENEVKDEEEEQNNVIKEEEEINDVSDVQLE